MTWGELYLETEAHALSTNGGVVSSTGIGGLSLGGGMGWLMGKYGLTVDNMLEVELVLADGSVAMAREEHNSDLFWAVRGGGGNFGIAASILYRLHEVGPEITGGRMVYPFDRARDVLRLCREFAAKAPDELGIIAGMVHAPDGSGAKLAAILVCHCGDAAAAASDLEPLKELGAPAVDSVGPTSISAINTILDDGFPRGALNYWKSSFIAELSDDAIDAAVDSFDRCPAPMGALIFEHVHGAVCRVAADETAFPHRGEGYNLLIVSQWQDPEQTPAATAWARETYAAMTPFSAGGRYVNYLDSDDDGDPVRAAYGDNYARLQRLKKRYDPDNVFHMNQNIPPAAD